ncbi:MAG: alpha-L-fucosidase [Clostridia bacterium]|nr:alpha-L-fucosidase [Clostridia bacterium]
MQNSFWFKEAQYGMMIHWGLYSLLGGEWNGQKITEKYAEWIQSNLAIPIREYEKLASAFNPVFFDAEQIVSLAKECGMKYLVVTAKHHDGFAMYHSKVDAFNVVDATPFGRDVIRELRNACAAAGLRFGIYYSQDLDWHEEHGGGYRTFTHCDGVSWDNSWDFPNRSRKNFSICFEKKILPQIRELMTEYGEISLVWFDVPMTLSEEQSDLIYRTVKELQPDCLINSRLGNGRYDYVSLGDNEIPTQMEASNAQVDYNSINGFKPSPLGLYETAATLNDTWGFSVHDHNWKSADQIRALRTHLNGLGINYLLNVGPDGLGRVPADAIRILRDAK